MAKKKISEASGALNPDETKILRHVLDHPEILTQVQNASDPVQELGALVDTDELGIDPNAAYELGDVLQFLDIHETKDEAEGALDERVVTDKVVAAFLAGTPKKVSNTETDGKSIYLFGNEIAKKEKDGLYISIGGHQPTRTTNERLNGLLRAMGLKAGVFFKKGELMLTLNGKDQVWDGEWTKVSDEMKGEDWEGSGKGDAKTLMAKTSNIPMMQDKEGEEGKEKVTEKKQIKLPKWAKKFKK